MKSKLNDIFFIKLTLTCLDRNNKRVKRKVEIGMIKTPTGENSIEYLKSYSSKREFQELIWKEIERHFSPDEVVVDFIKPKMTNSGIVLSGSSSYFKVRFKI